MTQREKILLGVVVGMAVLWGGWKGAGWYSDALSDRRDELQETTNQVDLAGTRTLLSHRAKKNLNAWQKQSLPADIEVAQTVYRAWLMESLGDAGLDYNRVRRSYVRPYADAYTSITYTAHAEGKLDQVTRFLYDFYKLPQIHKLTRLVINPLPDGDKLSMDITVEALVVSGTDRKKGLAEGDSGRLALADADAYVASIRGRNLFIPYTPPPPPRPKRDPKPVVVDTTPPPPPPAKPKFDHAKHAHVSGIIGNGDRHQVWITVRTTGESLRLYEGDKIEVGEFTGLVKSIDTRSITIEADGKLFQVSLGDHLRQGKPVAATAGVL